MAKRRNFTVRQSDRSDTYLGFDLDYTGSELEHVVLVISEGELNVYAVESPAHCAGLVRYLADEGFGAQILGVYSRSK